MKILCSENSFCTFCQPSRVAETLAMVASSGTPSAELVTP